MNLFCVYLEAVIGGCNQANHEVVWRIRPAGSTGSHKDALKCPKETPFRSNPTGLTPLRSRAGVRAANEGVIRRSGRSDMSIGILGTMFSSLARFKPICVLLMPRDLSLFNDICFVEATLMDLPRLFSLQD